MTKKIPGFFIIVWVDEGTNEHGDKIEARDFDFQLFKLLTVWKKILLFAYEKKLSSILLLIDQLNLDHLKNFKYIFELFDCSLIFIHSKKFICTTYRIKKKNQINQNEMKNHLTVTKKRGDKIYAEKETLVISKEL